MQLKLISQQMPALSTTTKHHCHHLPSGHTQHSNLQLSCFKCQPAVDYAVCFAIKAASQKNLMHFERKGYKVLFLKGAHYHDKEHTISVIKQACCRHMAPHTTQHVMWAVGSWSWNFCNVDWWVRKKNTLFFLLELHNVTVNDEWDVRKKNAMKSLGAVDSSCCCHCEISMWDCVSKNLCICGFTIWSEKVVWCLLWLKQFTFAECSLQQRAILWWQLHCNEICCFVYSDIW